MKTMRLKGVVQGALVCVAAVLTCSSFAQLPPYPYPTNLSIPVVTIRATVPVATWSGSPGSFTVTRIGNPVPALTRLLQRVKHCH